MTNWLQRTEFSPDLSNVKWREKIFKQELYNNLQNLTGLVLRKLKGGGRMESRADFNAEESGAAKLDLGKLVDLINEILEQQDKNSRQLTQVLRENINFQNQVRRGMYDELEELKDRQRGIAAVCVEYRTLLDDETISKKGRRTLQLLFEELEDILSEYDAEVFRSRVGEIRKPLLTKVINTISTDNREKHNTIAGSRRAGVIRNGRPLYREFVDVFVFNSTLTTKQPDNSAPTPQQPEKMKSKSEFARSE